MTPLRLRILTFVAGSAVLALTISGVLFEALASRIDARHAPGSFVDAGGRRLHFLCIGAGEPTVIFEPASLSRSVSFVDARTVLAQKTRVFGIQQRLEQGLFDRPGLDEKLAHVDRRKCL